jgi:hypothetical protein
LAFWRCRLTEDADFINAQVPLLSFEGSRVCGISADGIRVTGGVFLRNKSSADGEVRLLGAQIGGNLDCVGGTFMKLIAHTATITGNFLWTSVRNPEQATLGLRNASAGAIVDDEKRWPAAGQLDLDGFDYQRISRGPTAARKRMEWLKRQKDFTPQPYRQLAKVLHSAGDEVGAREVLYEMEHRRRQKADRWFGSNELSWRSADSLHHNAAVVRVPVGLRW